MIHTLRLQNFKGIRDVEVGLERLTVFVGPNGSGKTSFLQALDLLARLRLRTSWMDLNRQLFAHGYCNQYSSDNLIKFSVVNQHGRMDLDIKPIYFAPENHQATIIKGTTSQEPLMQIYIQDEHGDRDLVGVPETDAMLQSLDSTKLFRFDAGKIAEPSSGVDTSFQSDGTGLPSILAFLALNQPDEFALIQEEFRSLIPIMKRIRFGRSRAQRTDGTRQLNSEEPTIIHYNITDEIIFDLTNGKSIPASSASEGTLIVLALVTAFTVGNSDRLTLFLIDDLDRGLHPLAQRNLVELLRKVLEQQPDLQIVATTHSPYLVDSLRPEEVRMTTLNDDGTVACGRLVDHPKFEQWKNEMAPGELWSMFGEKWVSQSPPATETL